MHSSKSNRARSKTHSKSRISDSKQGKFVFTNRLDRQAERQKRKHAEHNDIIQKHIRSNPKMGQNYTERQFVGLQAANYTRRSKPPRTAFRSSKLRKIFDQFNENRT